MLKLEQMTPKSFDEDSAQVGEERSYGKEALLVLEDGTTYQGISCGADLETSSSGEVFDILILAIHCIYILGIL